MKPIAIAIARSGAKAILVVLVALATSLEGGPAWAARPGASAWGANYFPNVELITQEGAKVRFYDDLVKGKVFAINFIYTRCTDACPLETASLRKVYQALGERIGRDVFFYTISVDAGRDDPKALKAYAEKFKVGPGWTFLTGRKEDITLIRKKLGMYRNDGKEEKKLSEHSTVILMGNEPGGQWIKRSPFDEPQALARILGTRLHTTRLASTKPHDETGTMPAALATTPGGKLFQANCAACHELNKEDGIGPGLAGVASQRDASWLRRWIKEPDKLLDAKDPPALALFEKYNRVYMPNLRLSDSEVEALIQFMQGTDRLAQSTPAKNQERLR